jgi:hypothetical protein
MLVSVITLIVAIALLSLSLRLSDEVMQIVTTMIGRFCLFLSVVYAPWFIQLLIVLGILMIPVCTQCYSLRRTRCSRFCLARIHCADAIH